VGQKSSYAWLRKATLNGDGTVSYTNKGDVDTVKAAVAKAKNIVLYIHGIIGDTESMIPSVRYAKVNANGQTKSLEELYDLVLAFDYESLNTSIEVTARELKRQLAAVGLELNHGKTLHIVAHSMGGLVSRSFIEQGNGNEVVSHLIMVGTPNNGSPWATVHDLATTLLSFGLNLSSVPIVPSLLEKLVEAMSVTLLEMHATKSSFLDELKTFADPKCPYSIIAGSTALMDRTSEVKQLLDALKQKMRRVIELPFGHEENDIAVAVTSIIDVPKDRLPAVYTLAPIACDHLSYFRQTEGLHAISSVVGRAFGYPPDPLPPTRPSAPQGPQPNPVSPSPSSDIGTQSMRSTKGIPAESASNPNSSGDGNSSVNANASASTSGAADTNESVPLQPRQSEVVIASEPQVISQSSPQTEPIPSPEASPTPTQPQPNHATRTTTWFTKSHIIAIGIDKYESGIETLDNAVNDAQRIADIFGKQGFEKHLLLGEKDKPLVNRDAVRKLLTDLKSTVGENDRLAFYYAGHGIALPSQDNSEPDPNSQNSTNGKPETKPRNRPQGFLILQDAEQNKRETYLPMDDLIEWLSAISCRHYLMILDCCYAGAIQWSFGRTRQVLIQNVFPSLLDTFIDSPAWQILTSSDEDQPANDGLMLDLSLQKNNRVSQDKTSPNSPFVCFLEQALVEGKAQIAESQLVTTTELSSYLRRRVEESTSKAEKRQTPRLFTLPERHKRGEFVFLLDTFENVKKHLKEKFPDPKIDDEHNPYRGLQSYTEDKGNVFFGRKRLIEDLSEYVQTHLFTVVLGPSGVGKSSLVNAGLIPKLKGDSEKTELSQSLNSEEKTTQQPDSEPKAPPKWECKIFRPVQSVGDAFSKALNELEPTNIPDNTKRLLVIDQFEEFETQCRNEEQKKKFWNLLIAQLKDASKKLHIVVTLRSDFEPTVRSKFEDAIKKFDSENDKSKSKGRGKVKSTNDPKSTNEQSKFPIDWDAARFIVRAMEREELQEAIEKPAEQKAVFFTLEPPLKGGNERTLVQQLVNEVAGMPGALPLLSFALYTMYRNFAQRYVKAEKVGDLIKREITWEDYERLDGGVPKSLTNRATEEYNNLAFKLDENYKVEKDRQGNPIKEEQSIAQARQEMLRWVMLRMVTLDGGQIARRRVLRSELEYADPEKNKHLNTVITSFENARLLVSTLVSNKKYVEPAHDALIINWELLREWIKEEEENLTLRDRVIPDVHDWQELKNEEKPSNWHQHVRNALGNGLNWAVKQFRVKGELKRLNKQENVRQKQSIAASKNGHSSDGNTNVPAQETAETASENLPSNQAITEEVSSHMPENSHSSENKATVTAQETAQQGYANLTSQEAKGEEALSQTHSEGTRYPKSSDRLWDKNSRLDVLGQQLGKLQASKESWLNKTEADFVLHSLIKREKRRARRTTFLSSVGLVLLAATAWALNEQRNTLIEEIRTSRQSAEANLQANRDLEALTDILRAEKTFDNPLLWFGNLNTERSQVRGTLYRRKSWHYSAF
jgi:pimeloyl-ACP methyl ester carboxylesterase/energy-coupling factor transporter ATP-binding protein EcfA2